MNQESNMYVNGTYFENNPTWDAADSPWKATIINSMMERNRMRVEDLVEVGCGAGGILTSLAEKKPEHKKINRL